MFKNHIKIAWRSLTKNKLQTTINLLGLTVGTVCCLMILVYVNAQFGYDNHHDDSSSLYRIRTKVKTENNSIDTDMAAASPPIAFAMKEDFPEVVEACRIVYFGEESSQLLKVSNSDNSYYESRGYVADSTFFSFFKYPILEGSDPIEMLKAPNSVVLSSTLAQKLFGKKAALGQILILGAGEQQQNITVTGVFKDGKEKTHLNPNYILSMTSPGIGEFVRSVDNYATQNFVYSYLKLVPGTNPSQLEKKLPEFLQDRGADDLAAIGFDKTLLLQPVKDIHLYSKGIDAQIEDVSNIEYLLAMLLLAFIIQLVACVNFVNLSTAKAGKRAKEIGVRKVIGAQKSSLIRQFLSESVLLSLFAIFISVPLSMILLSSMNSLTGGTLVFLDIWNLKILTLLLTVGLLTGLLAGIYPALILSSIKPAKVIKGMVSLNLGSGNLRKTLVVFQFVVSIVLVTAVIIVTQQLKFAQAKDMGFDKDNLLAIKLGTQEVRNNFSAIREEYTALSNVSEVAGTNNYPSARIMGDMGMHLPGENPDNMRAVFYNGITENYFDAVGTKLIAGRPLRLNDSTQIIVNKATLNEFGIDLDNALSSKLIQTYEGQSTEYEIVGISEDFHFASLKQAVDPMLLFMEDSPDWLVVKAKTSNFKALLTNLERGWKKVNPSSPFEYTFVNDGVQKLFMEEQRLAKISLTFTILAIFISCLGLFGLVSYVAEQKKKEIGIRKVLGASVNSVVQLLTKDFIKLVGIAFLIASPIAYYFVQRWLEDFTYRIEIQWWVFALAGGFALVLTLLTVGFQSIKSAVANPVKSLRTE
ncbi:ABC transporter permease [uncultured Croceitalea sp.]|uniref:ABC transporter permease n=1 Tax=uncultured Croceitalea sp. TaxID=1798908 RepID=UPI003305971B